MSKEQVDHPTHYNAGDVECIDVIEWLPCNLANAAKYVWRAGLKGDLRTDLEKALWYIRRERARAEDPDYQPYSGAFVSWKKELSGDWFDAPWKYDVVDLILDVEREGVFHVERSLDCVEEELHYLLTLNLTPPRPVPSRPTS